MRRFALPLWMLIVASVSPFLIGCDTFSNSESSSPRDRLIGTWVVDQQKRTYSVVTHTDQTVLDPDAEARGAMTLQGTWTDGNRSRAVDERLRYVRHAARTVYQDIGRAVLISTQPVQNFETARRGNERSFTVQLSDVYDIQEYTYEPDGYLEGEIVNSYPDAFRGSPSLAADTLSAAPLPSAPVASPEPIVAFSALPFTPDETGADTLYVDGQLRPAVQRIRSGMRTPIDEEITSHDVLDQRRITYTFADNDSLFVTAIVNEDTLRTAGTWTVVGDTLQVTNENQSFAARFDLQERSDQSSSSFRMIAQEPLCATDRPECLKYYEFAFGLRANSLKKGMWEIRNNLVSTPNGPRSQRNADTFAGPRTKQVCSTERRSNALCPAFSLLRGGSPSLSPQR